jgi:hypothetical protein
MIVSGADTSARADPGSIDYCHRLDGALRYRVKGQPTAASHRRHDEGPAPSTVEALIVSRAGWSITRRPMPAHHVAFTPPGDVVSSAHDRAGP